MIRELLPGIHALEAGVQAGFRTQSYVLVTAGSSILIDVSDRSLAPALAEFPVPTHLILTHRHTRLHEAYYEEEFGLRVFLRAEDAQAPRCGPAVDTRMAREYHDPFSDRELAELGFRFIHVPGHTPGFAFAIWQRHGGVLFSGDAVVGAREDHRATDPLLALPPPFTSDNDAQLRASLAALDRPTVRHVLPLHGAPCLDMAEQQMDSLWAQLKRDASGINST